MKFIPLTRGFFATVDDEDFEWLSSYDWFAVPGPRTWYAVRNSTPDKYGKRRQVGMHQFLFFGGEEIDHIDGNGLDNQKCNLRFTSRNGNMHNKRKQSSPTSSRFKGVTWFKTCEKWVARISNKNGGNRNLGYCDDEVEAARAYDDAAKKYFGEFAKPNFA